MPERGALKNPWFHILLSVADEAMHGTAIMEDVLERTDGEVRLWPGMLYGCLRELSSEGLIRETEAPPDAPTEGGRRKFYRISPEGLAALRHEVARLETFIDLARSKGAAPERNPL